MKKILGIALLLLVVLVACNNGDNGETDNGDAEATASGATVCILEVMDEVTQTTIYEEDGYVTSFTTQTSLDVSELSQEDIDMAITVTQEMLGDIFDIEHVGNYIVTSMTIDGEYLEGNLTLEEVVEELEEGGATCN